MTQPRATPFHRPAVTVDLPPWRTVARQAARHLLENTVAPLAVFYLALATLGLQWAFASALALCWGVVAVRLVRRRPVPALLLLAAALITARGVIGLTTGSVFLYFLQPSLGNFAIGVVFLASASLGRPLIARLAGEFCAFPAEVVEHHRLQSFFRRVSLLWALVFCVNGAVAIWMLVSVPIGQYLLLSTSSSTGLIVLAAAGSLWWFRRSMHRAGMQVRVGGGPVPAPA